MSASLINHVFPYRVVFDLHFTAGSYKGVTLYSQFVSFPSHSSADEYVARSEGEFHPYGTGKDVLAVRRNIRVINTALSI